MQKYFESDYCDIEWDETNNIVFITYKKGLSSEQFRKMLNDSLELMIEKKSYKMLADTRKYMVVNQDDTEWVNKEYTPKAIKAGISKSAIIVPESTVAGIQMKRMVDANKGTANIDTMTFTNHEEAIEWLKA